MAVWETSGGEAEKLQDQKDLNVKIKVDNPDNPDKSNISKEQVVKPK